MPNSSYSKAFTIVELMIVIVVIAVLAAITIVTFTGMQQRAIEAGVQTDLDTARKKVMLYHAENGAYPTAINCNNTQPTELCMRPSSATTLSYSATNSGGELGFSLTAQQKDIVYQTTDKTVPEKLASIATNGLVSLLDPGMSTSYPGSGTLWKDISGNGRDAVINANTLYSTENGGVLLFDATSSNMRLNSGPLQSLLMFVYISPSQTASRYLIDSRNGNPAGYLYSSNAGNWINMRIDTQAVASTWSSLPVGRWFAFYGETSASYTSTVNIMSRYSNGERLAGKLGIVLAYDRTLTQAEIERAFNTYRVRYGIPSN